MRIFLTQYELGHGKTLSLTVCVIVDERAISRFFFLIFLENICSMYSLEVLLYVSDEYPQHIFMEK